jgi:hypothetical protein
VTRRLVAALLVAATPALAQQPAPPAEQWVPDLAALRPAPGGDLERIVSRYTTDRDVVRRRYAVASSAARRQALDAFDTEWLTRVEALDFSALGQSGKVDWLLLRAELVYARQELARDARQSTNLATLLPFNDAIAGLDESRRRFETTDPPAMARALTGIAEAARRARQSILASSGPDTLRPTRIAAYRSAQVTLNLRTTLERWYRFYDGYDPLFTWWSRVPWAGADSALRSYAQTLREHVVGIRPGEDEPIVGVPISRAAIMEDLAHEMIPYTPEELVTIARREFAWCEAEMRRAARDMGLGDDWRAALERVKNDYLAPGRQTDLVRDLEREAEQFLETHDLVTVPPLARDIWRMEMMSPERQKENPFFTGGEVMTVSFPTDAMSEADKLMSMRGNNIHFARATVFHELIPGHHLQGFMTDRYATYRDAFSTPFWGEGNAFYWETLFWDLGFPRSAEDRVGMLFWRMHRAARIIFSLSFHLGTMTPEQATDFLVERVGHERANAVAEVRRSFNGNYSPLYQVAYMIGGLQFRALHHELVDSGRMTNRQFHDAILHNGRIPVEALRALLTDQQVTRDFRMQWRFADR